MRSQPEMKRRSRARRKRRRQVYWMRTLFGAVVLAAVVGIGTILGSWLKAPTPSVREESQTIQSQTMAEY